MNRVFAALIITVALVWVATSDIFPADSVSQSQAALKKKVEKYCSRVDGEEVLAIRVQLIVNVGVKKGGPTRVIDRNLSVECVDGVISLNSGLGTFPVTQHIVGDPTAFRTYLREELEYRALKLILVNGDETYSSLDGDGRSVMLRDAIEADLIISSGISRDVLHILR